MATPTLVQHVSTANTGLPSFFGVAGTGGIASQFDFRLPNPALAGNCLILGVTASAGITISTPTDDGGNTWTAGPTATDSTNHQQGAIFYALNVVAGTRHITIPFSSFLAPTRGDTFCAVKCSEFFNVALSAASDGSNGNANSGTSWTAGSFTPTTNGDLIWNCGWVDSAGTIGVRASGSGTFDVAIGAASGSTTVTIPSGTQPGDLMIASVCVGWITSAGTITTPSGWTAVEATVVAGFGTLSAVFWRIAQAGDSTWSFPIVGGTGNGFIGVALQSFTGCDQTNPIDSTGTGSSNTGSNTITANAVTVAFANSWELIGLAQDNTGTASATGFTVLSNAGSAAQVALLYNATPKATGSTGTVTVTGGGGASGNELACTPFAIRPAQNSISWTAGSGFSLLDADIIDNWSQGFSQYQVQATAGSINPGATVGAALPGVSLGIALKSATAGTAPPANGIRVVRIQWGSIYPLTLAATIPFQFPCSGNLLACVTDTGDASATARPVSSITDSGSNTWVSAVSEPDPSSLPYTEAIWYAGNATTAATLHGTITMPAVVLTSTYAFFDIAGAATSPLGNTGKANGNQTTNGHLVTCSVTPSQANGLVIGTYGVDFGTGLGICGSGFLFDSPTYPQLNNVTTGTPASPLAEDEGCAHIYNTGTSTLTFTYATTSDFQGGANTWSAACAEFKAATPTANPYVGPLLPSSPVQFNGVSGMDSFFAWTAPSNFSAGTWEAYGSGGAGANVTTTSRGTGGGSGGGYAKRNAPSITAGNAYAFCCAGGGTNPSGTVYNSNVGFSGCVDETPTFIKGTAGICAAANSTTGASAGSASTGDTVHLGGAGANGGASTAGGGGGGAGGQTGAGSAGSGSAGGSAGSGGSIAGAGGGGHATSNGVGTAGSNYGGGGGGSFDSSASQAGAAGGPGAFVITFSVTAAATGVAYWPGRSVFRQQRRPFTIADISQMYD